MKLFAHYDASGTIRSLTWYNAPQGVSLTLTPRPGETVTEVEGHGLTAEMPTEQKMREIAKNSSIEAPAARVKLSKKRK